MAHPTFQSFNLPFCGNGLSLVRCTIFSQTSLLRKNGFIFQNALHVMHIIRMAFYMFIICFRIESNERFIKCHLPFEIMKENVEKHPELKIIQTIRNPKDALISYYFHSTADELQVRFLFLLCCLGHHDHYRIYTQIISRVEVTPDSPGDCWSSSRWRSAYL